MIYLRLNDVQKNLQEVSERISDYEEDQTYKCGYNTAWDVATCINEDSIWHKAQEQLPNGQKVLAYADGDFFIGRYQNGTWYNGSNTENGVVAWAELPDVPFTTTYVDPVTGQQQ